VTEVARAALLVLPDEPFSGQLASALTALGWQVRVMGSGQEASASFAASPADLVVVDGQLPDIDGASFISQLRQGGSRVPVAFISAVSRDLEAFRRLTDELQVAVVAHKPVALAGFVEQLSKAIEAQARDDRDAAAEFDLKQAMAALKAEYARSLPRKLGELAHSIYQAKARPEDPVLSADVRAQVHRLRGTAAAYGFPAVGAAAGGIEELMVAPSEAVGGRARQLDAQAWIEIEKELAAAVRALEAAEVATSAAAAAPASAAMRVLAVDHDSGFLTYLVELGRQRLVEVVAVRTAEEALAAAAQTRFEAAFIDELLPPHGRAVQLALELRSLPGLGALPLAFLSLDGQGMKNRVAAAHAGASLYLCKPLDADSFSLAVHQLSVARSTDQPHILVVDDDPDFSAQLQVLLRHERMRVTLVSDPSQVLRVLEDSPVDVVLLDGRMPGLHGVDVCRVLRVTPRWQDIPVLFLTAETAPEARTAAFEAGADDYLLKPIVREELLARIRVRVERMRLLRERSDRDAVTGLLVRRAFIQGLGPRWVEAQRHGWPLAVCLLDLDHFKGVNDRYGHLAGDRVLASLGSLLERRFRAEDLRGRWGGEEFILAFPGEGTEAVKVMVARVLEELEAVPFTSDEGEVFHVSFSAGVAVFPDDAGTVTTLLKAADRRLYEAKDLGRRRVVSSG
jgi:diguanylate cyclase (GGDEF)-like protein